jgi:hypothetical protein
LISFSRGLVSDNGFAALVIDARAQTSEYRQRMTAMGGPFQFRPSDERPESVRVLPATPSMPATTNLDRLIVIFDTDIAGFSRRRKLPPWFPPSRLLFLAALLRSFAVV